MCIPYYFLCILNVIVCQNKYTRDAQNLSNYIHKISPYNYEEDIFDVQQDKRITLNEFEKKLGKNSLGYRAAVQPGPAVPTAAGGPGEPRAAVLPELLTVAV